jgi:hypothetical protein
MSMAGRKLSVRACSAAGAFGVVLAAALYVDLRLDARAREALSLQRAIEQASSAGAQISAAMDVVEEAVHRSAQSLTTAGEPNEARVLAALRELMFAGPGFVRAGVAFAPFAFQEDVRLFAPSYVARSGGMALEALDAALDYTRPGNDWYHEAMRGAALWLPPYYDARSQGVVARYATPLHHPVHPGEPIGVLFASFSVDVLRDVLDDLDTGEYGYSFVLSGDGRFVLHPNADLVARGEKPHPSLAEATGRPDIPGTVSTQRLEDPEAGLPARVLLQTLTSSAWTFGVVLADRDTGLPNRTVDRRLLQIAAVLAIVAVLAAVAFALHRGDLVLGAWLVSGVFAGSCVLIGLLAVLLEMSSVGAPANDATSAKGAVRVTSRHELQEFIAAQRRRTLRQREEVPLFVPTGLFVQSISLEDATSIRIGGYLWQRYRDGIHDGLERGFLIPDTRSLQVSEASVQHGDDSTLLRWNFNAVIHQRFDHSQYPFDREQVTVQLRHKDFTANVILVPDLDSYKLNMPSARPGLSDTLGLAGWSIEESSFAYYPQSYSTSFGHDNFSGLSNFPELSFNVSLSKQVTGPFVSNMLPLLVVNILLFAILMLGAREERQRSHLGFTLDVIAACAGFFLVVIFLHIALRRSIAARDIFYLEYFYFVTYAMILYVTVNYVLFTKTALRFVHYRDNFVAKIAFWPLSQLALLIATMVVFY